MLVTCLTPKIGYDLAAKCAKLAQNDGISLREAVIASGCMSGEEYDETVDPVKLV